MNNEFWKLKVAAFLHDPLNKALILGERDAQPHEEFARELAKLLGIDGNYIDKVKEYDRIAAAFDRSLYKELKDKNGNFLKVSFVKKPVLVHPLSYDEYDLRKFGELYHWSNIESLEEKISTHARDTVIQMLRLVLKNAYIDNTDDKSNIDYKKLYFILWRLSIPMMIAVEQQRETDKDKYENRLGYLWHLLPADTRTPNHSVFLHDITTSAFVGTLETPVFFIFTIGPVQKFIEQARKTSDLLAGSLLLSYLIFRSMEPVIEKFGPDSIIFPNLFEAPLMDVYLQSKYAIFDLNSGDDLEQAGENTYNEKMRDMIKKELEKSLKGLFIPTMPNRFFAVLPKDRAVEIAKEVEESFLKAKNELFSAAEDKIGEIWEKLGLNIDKEYIDKTFDRQKDGAFEYYWVINAAEKGSGGWREVYQKEYTNTESALGTRKRVREFKQAREEGEKCTICGERSVLMPYKPQKRDDYREIWGKIHAENASIVKNEHEQLCLMGILKREFLNIYGKILSEKFGIKQSNFEHYKRIPSVAQVAFAEYIKCFWEQYANVEKVNDEWLKLITMLQGSLGEDFYVERVARELHSVNIEKYGNGVRTPLELKLQGELYDVNAYDRISKDFEGDNPEILKNIKKGKEYYNKIFKSLKKVKKEHCMKNYEKYYGVMQFDGDRMGKWLSGEYLENIERYLHPQVKLSIDRTEEVQQKLSKKQPISPAIHRFMSHSLSQFASKIVPRVIGENYGFLIYAGGDDVLAFAPKHRALNTAFSTYMLYGGRGVSQGRAFHFGKKDEWHAISEKSYIMINNRELVPTMGHVATASAGLVFAHYLTPLSIVLEKAREVEKYAKNTIGRDAFGIYLMKRSGEHINAGDKWLKKVNSNDKKFTFPAALFVELMSTLMEVYTPIDVRKDKIDTLLKFYQEIYTEKDIEFLKEKLPIVSLSDSFVVQLTEEFESIAEQESSELEEMLQVEIKRLLMRKISVLKIGNTTGNDAKNLSKNDKKQIVEFISDNLIYLYKMPENFMEGEAERNKIISNNQRFFNLLNIARFLGRRSEDV